jgi:glycosyltransferase involved in cell wall biosynthesis
MSRSNKERHLCIVDLNFTLESPTMKHLVYAVPPLIDAGWRISAIAENIEPNLPVEFLRLKPESRLPLFSRLALAGRLQRGARDFRAKHPDAIIFGTPGLPHNAHMSAVQFLSHIWLREARKIPTVNLRERAGLFLSKIDDWRTAQDFRLNRTAVWLPVSESIARELQKVVARPERIKVLPNSYDESRFNLETVYRLRSRKRAELHFGSADFVFAFLSQGHHRRKGFWVAVEALTQLRAGNRPLTYNPQLLVIGGIPATLIRLKKELSRTVPDWSRWIRFTGMVSCPEESLAATDAFLFPSFFEAFCLAEIETAAMGLPLLLTAHYGSEMILRHGRNGLTISSEAAVLAKQLFDFLSGASQLGPIDPVSLRPKNFHLSVGRALTRSEYSSALLQLLEAVYEERVGAPGQPSAS